MAALRCDCGKLFLSGKLSFISKYVYTLGCTEFNYMSHLQKRYYVAPKIDEVVIQEPKKKRDRLTVLRALASTVEHVPNRPDYRFIDDVVLNPRSLIKQKELHLAIDSGTKAAGYVLEKYPHLFPLRDPVPAWQEEESIIENMEVSVENLLLLMQTEENVSKVVDWYRKLDSEGNLSLEMHNDMLDFVSFHAVPNDTKSSVEQVEDGNANKSKWKNDGLAEKLFRDLKDKGNSRTYEVFILGLLKNGEIFRAFKIYQEFAEKNFSGSLYLYNTLLSHVCEFAGDKEGWDLVQDIVNCMRKNQIQPDVLTFNSLMAVAVERSEEPQLCQQLLREMKKLKISPSLGSYYFILMAERKKTIQDINVLHAIVKDLKNGVVQYTLQHPADTMFFHSAMDLARFKRHAGLAKDLLDIVINNGLIHLLGIRSSSFFGNYLCAIARNATDLDYVFQEYHRLVPKFFVPRDWVIQQLLLAMRNNKNPEKLPSLYSDMVSMRIPFSERGATSLFQAMEESIPKDRAEEFLFVVSDAEKWMDVFRIKQTPQTVSVSIKVLCLCGRNNRVKEKLEECNKLQIVPSADAMCSILELNINEGDKQGALSTLKSMARFKMTLTNRIEQMIMANDFLSEKRSKINLWFNIT